MPASSAVNGLLHKWKVLLWLTELLHFTGLLFLFCFPGLLPLFWTTGFRQFILNKWIAIKADLLTLATAIEPFETDKIAEFFKLPVNDDGFFIEAHPKLRPVDFAIDGVFLCGMAHYPKSIDESIAQALAASSRATGLIATGKVLASGTVAHVNPLFCSSCGVCLSICPYSAPSFAEEGFFAGKAEINPVLCKGCGLCVASCRSGAINLKGFGEEQIMAMIDEV